MKKSFFYIIVFFALQVFALAVAWAGNLLVNGAGSPLTVVWMLIMQAVFTLSCIGVFLWRRWTPVAMLGITWRNHDTPDKQRHGRQAVGALLAWAVVAALGTIVPSMWVQEQLTFLPDWASKDMMTLIMHPLGYFVIGILAPVSEEIIFRGAILRELLRWFHERSTHSSPQTPHTYSSWLAISLSALLFAVAHCNPAQMPHAFLLGLLLGWLCWRSGSILPGILVHVTNNTVAFLLARSYPFMDDLTLQQLLGGSNAHVLQAIACSLCILLPALNQLQRLLQNNA